MAEMASVAGTPRALADARDVCCSLYHAPPPLSARGRRARTRLRLAAANHEGSARQERRADGCEPERKRRRRRRVQRGNGDHGGRGGDIEEDRANRADAPRLVNTFDKK